MDYRDLDAEAQEKRKKDQVAYRTKKRFSNNFMLLASLFEIIETLVLMCALFLLSAFLFFKVFNVSGENASNIYWGILVAIFVIGMIGGFLIYKRVIRFVIKKLNLKDKLVDDVLIHYFKEGEL